MISVNGQTFGLQETLRELTAYILGASNVPYIPYQDDADWTPYLPRYESQSDKYPTCCCSVWGAHNQIEILYKRLYGTEPNYSERFNSALLQIRCPGIDPQKTYESIRTQGLVKADDFPMPDTYEEFLDASQITGSLLAKGLNWLHQHDFMHEWLWTSRPENYLDILKDALKTSPIACSVSAWFERDGLFVDLGQPNNHWVVIYKIDEEGIHIFDSYNHSQKTLALNHNIKRAKRIWINKKTVSALKRHKNILQVIVAMLMEKRTFVQVCKAALGTDASPRDYADDELACSESVTTLLKQVYPELPVITGTWTFNEFLKDPKNGFVRVTVPTPGTIIISPTGTGHGVGHVGVYLEDEVIASNTSFGINKGRFLANYTTETWLLRYRDKQGMQVNLYKHL